MTPARPLGCLTGSALLAAGLAAFLVWGAARATNNQVFSPGGLNAQAGDRALGEARSHADLDQDCGACHTAFWTADRMGERCLNCHGEVREEISRPDAFHSGYATGANCRDCHTEHHGPAGSLTRADMRGFPHERTGFRLETHRLRSQGGGIRCADCHPDSYLVFLAGTCYACHHELDPAGANDHRDSFGPDCLACHDGVDRYGRGFDHDRTVFSLEGRHEQVDCSRCHPGARTPEALRSAPQTCLACHANEDVHDRRLGSRCGDCHTPDGWETARLDHDQTRFPLTGRHDLVACEACHADGQWDQIGMACRSCHLGDDPHAGQFRIDCRACHTPQGWELLQFDHRRSRFPLEEAHAAVECGECHREGRYADTPMRCVACHARDDAHEGRFGDDCGACHRATTWAEANFDHDLAAFRLTGAHRTTACLDCHTGGTFLGTPLSCSACHNRPGSHGAAFTAECSACHSTSAWRPASYNGPHSFPMNHGGAGGRCGLCHPNSLFAYRCGSCHRQSEMADKHQGITSDLGNCIRCHPNGSVNEGGED